MHFGLESFYYAHREHRNKQIYMQIGSLKKDILDKREWRKVNINANFIMQKKKN